MSASLHTTVELPRWITEMRPIMISAPVGRSGTTLMQRLINSTRKAVIFGENLHFFDFTPRMIFSVLDSHCRNEASMDATRERARLGQIHDWEVNQLWPDTREYTAATLEYFCKLVSIYQSSADRMGMSRWGLKFPLHTMEAFFHLRQLLPNARHVFIYRNLFDTARSVKARKLHAGGEESWAGFARSWAEHLTPILDEGEAGKTENLLVVSYEALLDEPELHCQALEAFTGVEGIDRSEFEHKFNTFIGTHDQGRSPTGYIEPAPLTDAEIRGLIRGAGDLLERLDYQPSLAS